MKPIPNCLQTLLFSLCRLVWLGGKLIQHVPATTTYTSTCKGCTTAYYRILRCLGSILILLKVHLPPGSAVIYWYAVITIHCNRRTVRRNSCIGCTTKPKQCNQSQVVPKIILIIFQSTLSSCLTVLPWWAANRTYSRKNNLFKLMQKVQNCKNAYYSILRCLESCRLVHLFCLSVQLLE